MLYVVKIKDRVFGLFENEQKAQEYLNDRLLLSVDSITDSAIYEVSPPALTIRDVGYYNIRFKGKERRPHGDQKDVVLFQFNTGQYCLFQLEEDYHNIDYNRYVEEIFKNNSTIEDILTVLRKRIPTCDWSVSMTTRS